ncbi:MAG TPA: hypothetical protein VGZ73_12730 [Bryobacteraceae bacterium]|jgi:hypothetical protein|nr:hypothetical protein [Bryobacteraceae bacterium]
MTPARYQRIERLFHDARERAPEDRKRLLDTDCNSNTDLRAEVERLVLEFDEPTGFWKNRSSRPIHQAIGSASGSRIGTWWTS